jgi:hypothetical protein
MNNECDHKEECGCLFCNSICPECGSEEIDVHFTYGFSYSNDTKDSISIMRGEKEIELECNKCGCMITGGDCSHDTRIDKILIALEKGMNLPDIINIDIDENGDINYQNLYERKCKA